MAEVLYYAIPAFVLLLVMELLSFKYLRDDNVVINAVWKLVVLVLAHDVRAAKSWRDKLGYVFHGPGWSPDGSGGGTRG